MAEAEDSDAIPFEVMYARSTSGEEDSEKLTSNLRNGTGWVSKKGCSYPQELLLDLHGDVNLVRITIQVDDVFLSTDSYAFLPLSSKLRLYLAKQVDFYIGHGEIYDDFTSPDELELYYIGTLEFSKYDKGEKKSLYCDEHGSVLSLKIRENFQSRTTNKFNQVGLQMIAVNGFYDKKRRDSGEYQTTRCNCAECNVRRSGSSSGKNCDCHQCRS